MHVYACTCVCVCVTVFRHINLSIFIPTYRHWFSDRLEQFVIAFLFNVMCEEQYISNDLISKSVCHLTHAHTHHTPHIFHNSIAEKAPFGFVYSSLLHSMYICFITHKSSCHCESSFGDFKMCTHKKVAKSRSEIYIPFD